MRLPLGADITPTPIYNPTKEDFVCLQADDNNKQQEYIFPSRQIATFPKFRADFIAKKLAHKIAIERGARISYDIRYKEALDSITVLL